MASPLKKKALFAKIVDSGSLGPMQARTIVVVPYCSSWAESFRFEKTNLEGALGSVVVGVHHIGSTSVTGLAAKPIIDILVVARSLAELDANALKLRSLDYLPQGEYGIPRRRYFTKGMPVRTYQLHAFERGDPNIERHLAFRDYLRARPDVAEEYARVKTAAAASCNGDIDAYMDTKSPFIRLHEALALESHRSRRRGNDPQHHPSS